MAPASQLAHSLRVPLIHQFRVCESLCPLGMRDAVHAEHQAQLVPALRPAVQTVLDEP